MGTIVFDLPRIEKLLTAEGGEAAGLWYIFFSTRSGSLCTCLPKRPWRILVFSILGLFLLILLEVPIPLWTEPGAIAFVMIIWEGSALRGCCCCCCFCGWYFEVKSGPEIAIFDDGAVDY